MFRSRNKQKTIERATEYASCKDFKQIFTEDMARAAPSRLFADCGPC